MCFVSERRLRRCLRGFTRILSSNPTFLMLLYLLTFCFNETLLFAVRCTYSETIVGENISSTVSTKGVDKRMTIFAL